MNSPSLFSWALLNEVLEGWFWDVEMTRVPFSAQARLPHRIPVFVSNVCVGEEEEIENLDFVGDLETVSFENREITDILGGEVENLRKKNEGEEKKIIWGFLGDFFYVLNANKTLKNT